MRDRYALISGSVSFTKLLTWPEVRHVRSGDKMFEILKPSTN